MARVLGESGRYASDAAEREWRRFVMLAFLVIGLLGLVEGVILASYLPRNPLPLWSKTVIALGAIPFLWAFRRWSERKFQSAERRYRAFRRGADGEDKVAWVLSGFPDEFHVINDLGTPYGNLDHVVVGPTGVFVIETKSWRGVVSSNGKGELMLNNGPTDKPHIRPFLGRVLSVRGRVRTLAPDVDPYYQAVFVFTSARVEAAWGATGRVHCVRDDQLQDYIVEKDFGKRLKDGEVQRLAQAFLALAHMERDFTDKSTSPRPPDGDLSSPSPTPARHRPNSSLSPSSSVREAVSLIRRSLRG